MIQQTSRTTIETIQRKGIIPSTIFERLQGEHKFLLETSSHSLSKGRFSIMGMNPRKTYVGSQTTLKEIDHRKKQSYTYEGDLVLLLKQMMPRINNDTMYPFTGGAVGYIRFNREEHIIPAAQFHVYDTVFLYDHTTEQLHAIHTNIDPEIQTVDLKEQLQQLISETDIQATSIDIHLPENQQTIQEEQFNELSKKLEKYQIEQLVVAKTVKYKLSTQPFDYYKAFQTKYASAYQYFIEFGAKQLIGSAHDRIIQVHQQQITTAENTCESISVKGSIQRNGHHYTSQLKPEYHAIDALAATIPTEKVIGYPKQHALSFIPNNPLDTRLLFGGAVGYIGFNGQIDFTHTNDAILLEEQHVYLSEAYKVYPHRHFETFTKDGESQC